MLDRKKTITLMLIIVFILSFNLSVKAEEEKGLTPAQIKKELLRGFKRKLNDTSWEITLRNSSGQEEADVISFEDFKVGSRKLLLEGFKPSNFTVRTKGDRKIIWETMQTSAKKGVAFWRGDILASDIEKGAVMRGVLSWHIKDGVKRDYNFTSKGWDGRKASKEEPKSEEPAPAIVPAIAPEPVKAEEPIAKEAPIEEETIVKELPKEVVKEAPKEEPVQETPKKEVKTPEPKKKKKRKAWWQKF